MNIDRFFIFPTYDKLNETPFYLRTKSIFLFTSLLALPIMLNDSKILKYSSMALTLAVIFIVLKYSIRNISAFIKLKKRYNLIMQDEINKSKDKTNENNNKRFNKLKISDISYTIDTESFYLIYLYPNIKRTYFILVVANLNLDLLFNINTYLKFKMYKAAMIFYLMLLYVSSLLAYCTFFIFLIIDPIFAVVATFTFSIIDKFILDTMYEKLKLYKL